MFVKIMIPLQISLLSLLTTSFCHKGGNHCKLYTTYLFCDYIIKRRFFMRYNYFFSRVVWYQKRLLWLPSWNDSLFTGIREHVIQISRKFYNRNNKWWFYSSQKNFFQHWTTQAKCTNVAHWYTGLGKCVSCVYVRTACILSILDLFADEM